ncbi:MAG: transposase [Gammaproteobacteria bacterium]
MARQLRIEFPGAVYHVTSRGNARLAIYEDDGDREDFLQVLSRAVDRYHWLCHAYCLMGNHYHLLMETPEGNLSKGMRHLNGVYTQRYNRGHGRAGHLLQGRFKAILVERDRYLLELCRYVVLNPVRANLVKSLEHYPWSSFPATAGFVDPPTFLTTGWILGQFGKRRSTAQRRYIAFVEDGMAATSPWRNVRGQVLLGSDEFVKTLTRRLDSVRSLKEIPRVQRFANRPGLEVLFGKRESRSRAQRNRLIRAAHLKHGYTLTEIASAIDLHYTTVSKIVNAQSAEERSKT